MKLEEALPALRAGKLIYRTSPIRETKWGNHLANIENGDTEVFLSFESLLADDWEVEDE